MDLESDGVLDHYTPNRPLSLLEKKQLKWSQEKADQTEWFPFGRPGAGAPLKLAKSQKIRNDADLSAPKRDPIYDSQIPKNQNNYFNGDHYVPSSNSPGFVNNQSSTNISSNSNSNTNANHFLPQLTSYPSPYSSVYSPPYTTFVNYPHGISNQNGSSFGLGGVHNTTPVYQNLPFLPPPPINFATFQQPNGVAFSTPNQLSLYGEQWIHPYGHLQQRSQSQLDMKQQFVPSSQFPYFNSSSMQLNDYVKNMQPNFSSSPIYANQTNLQTANIHPTAWISPQLQTNNNSSDYGHQSKLNEPHHNNTAIVSPFQNNNFVSGSGDQKEDLTTSSKSQEYEIHRRRNAITDPKDGRDLKEKIIKANETKAAFDEQIAEKQRQKLLKLELEREEIKRLERDRELLEYRERQENENELNKWRRLMKEEERRERSIKDSWEKAKEEALKSKRSRLLQHALKKKENVENFNDDSLLTHSPSLEAASRSNLTNDGQHSDLNQAPSLSGTSYGNTDDVSRSHEKVEKVIESRDISATSPQNIQISSNVSPFAESFIDDRPIRPLTKDPLKLWDSATKRKLSLIASKSSSFIEPLSNNVYENDSLLAAVDEVVRRSKNVENFSLRNFSDKKVSPTNDSVHDSHINRSSVDFFDRKKLTPKKSADLELRASSPLINANNPDRISNKPFLSPAKPTGVEPKIKQSLNFNRVENNVGYERNKNVTTRKKDKLLSRPVALNSNTLATSENDENPWGDKLGGVNPLLQPLQTRSKKSVLLSPTDGFNDEKKLKSNNERDSSTKNVQNKHENFDHLRLKSQEEFSRLTLNPPSETSSVTNSDLRRNNFRNHKYSSSLSVKRQPSNNKSSNDIFDSLTRLREQLKQNQKTVEDSLSVPRFSSKQAV